MVQKCSSKYFYVVGQASQILKTVFSFSGNCKVGTVVRVDGRAGCDHRATRRYVCVRVAETPEVRLLGVNSSLGNNSNSSSCPRCLSSPCVL